MALFDLPCVGGPRRSVLSAILIERPEMRPSGGGTEPAHPPASESSEVTSRPLRARRGNRTAELPGAEACE
jgi:hypothetical protein